MARKQRRLEQVATAANEPKAARYQDPFQSAVVHRVESVGQKFEGKGRTIIYALGALILVAIVAGVFYQWNRRSNGTAQAALGKAIEISQARVTEVPPPAGSTQKTFKSEKERSEAAIAEFQIVVDKFGGSVGEKAKYFIAVNKLVTDRASGIQDLEGLSTSSSEVGKLAKFALAQTRVEDGKLDDAAAMYADLAGVADSVVAKDTINFQLAKVLEKQGKTAEAVDAYYKIAKAASEAKDAEGKPTAMSETGRNAKDKLKQLDPAKAAEIKEVDPNTTVNGNPITM
jgi:hypothetical protein